MRIYVGCKIIQATQMTDVEFQQEKTLYESSKNTVRKYEQGRDLLRDFSPSAIGVYENQKTQETKDGYKVIYPDGYTSWSPKEVFEQCYRLVSDSEKKLI